MHASGPVYTEMPGYYGFTQLHTMRFGSAVSIIPAFSFIISAVYVQLRFLKPMHVVGLVNGMANSRLRSQF
jgi:NADPH-dependent curcumin reductase CurA